MNIFKSIYSSIYPSFVKSKYSTFVKETDAEKILSDEKGYLFIVKDKEVAKRLITVIPEISKNSKTKFSDFKITKYGLNNKGIQWFCVSGSLINEFYSSFKNISLSIVEKINRFLEIVKVIEDLHALGFGFDASCFDISKCKTISEYLSYFKVAETEEEIEKSNGLFLEQIHYELSDGILLKDYFNDIFQNKATCTIDAFPYLMPLALLCFNYFKTGKVSCSIFKTLLVEYSNQCSNFKYGDEGRIIALDKLKESEISEQTEEYTIYAGYYKIYHNISSEFADFLSYAETSKYVVEQMENVIIDFDNNIIGYKISEKEKCETALILDVELTRQASIFDFIKRMTNMVSVYSSSEYPKVHDAFNIEQNLFLDKSNLPNYYFRTSTIKDLYNLIVTDVDLLKTQFTLLLFKLIKKYMKNKYGELNSKEQILTKNEIKFLNPLLAREYIKYALNKDFNIDVASDALFDFLDNNKVCLLEGGIRYDSRFSFNPSDMPYVFDFEIENEYNITLEKGTTKELDDGYNVVIYKRSKTIYNVLDMQRKNFSTFMHIRNPLLEIYKTLHEFKKYKLVITSDWLNSADMYNVIGYIPMEDDIQMLTRETLAGFNNKQLVFLMGSFLACFEKEYFLDKCVWYKEKSLVRNPWLRGENLPVNFYIDTLSEEFKTYSLPANARKRKRNADVVQYVFEQLVAEGYNPNAFLCIDFDTHYNEFFVSYLVRLAGSYDTFCDEHQIYFAGHEGYCPICSKVKYKVPKDVESVLDKRYEDSIAVHYSLDNEYNLKLYKSTFTKLCEVEANVGKIITQNLLPSKQNSFHQDCFIPCKKAFDENEKFVGLVYKKVKFQSYDGNIKDVCVDLKDTENLTNFHRVKSLIRLVTQIKEIISENQLGFLLNPFEQAVFLNSSCKKQVQVLNVEFLTYNKTSEHAYEDIENWLKKYIEDVWLSDSKIKHLQVEPFKKNFNLSRKTHSIYNTTTFINYLDFLLVKLNALVSDEVKYCGVHKMYYRSSFLCCPECFEPARIAKHSELENKSNFESSQAMGEGGESFIYSYSADKVVKVFKEDQVNIEFKSKVIFKILSKEEVLKESNAKNLKFKYIIPEKILFDQGSRTIFGYLMDKVKDAYPISRLRDKAQREKLGISRNDVLDILITIAEGISYLHEVANIFIGDLNGQNILFDLDKNVYFIDFDGMGVDEISPEFCTEEYIDPVSKKNQKITKKDDWYSLAVQAFHYLTYTHPFNGIYFESVDGRKVSLDVADKMERRISLLGNHGMEPPKIAEPWDWMTKELLETFKNIFEGNYRQSFAHVLRNQYNVLLGNISEESLLSEEISTANDILSVSKVEATTVELPSDCFRLNPKFIARELNLFSETVVKVINNYSAICEKDGEKNLVLLLNVDNQVVEKSLGISDYENITDVRISNDGKIAFLIYGEEGIIHVVDLAINALIYREDMPYPDVYVISDKTMYLKEYLPTIGEACILQRTILPSDGTTRKTIRVGKESIRTFNVLNDSKYVLISNSGLAQSKLYCNTEHFLTFTGSGDVTPNFKIIYDAITKMWLVMDNEGTGVIIEMSGKVEAIDFVFDVNDDNINSVEFVNGNIYIPFTDKLLIYNVKSAVQKKLDCPKIMNSSSKLFDINSKGFSVLTDNAFYEVRRG